MGLNNQTSRYMEALGNSHLDCARKAEQLLIKLEQMEGENIRLTDENAELKRTIERMNLDCSCE